MFLRPILEKLENERLEKLEHERLARLENERLERLEILEKKRVEQLKRDSCSWKPNLKLEGIISYLTKKHGGNVREKGIVTITSNAVARNADCGPKNVGDLTSNSPFCSRGEPGEWVCWDFRKMRVRPTHYTLRTPELRSWVVEGSQDGESWTELDRQRNNQDFKTGAKQTSSFAVSNSPECRFIRLTQTARNHLNSDHLFFCAVEFFGTLCE
jgi:hypothetical protein